MKKKYAKEQLQEAITRVYGRSIKLKATKYNYDYRIWHDYAGDYKHK